MRPGRCRRDHRLGELPPQPASITWNATHVLPAVAGDMGVHIPHANAYPIAGEVRRDEQPGGTDDPIRIGG
jgi:hypothetical protein